MQIIQIERKCKFLRMRLKLRYIFLVKVEPRWGLNQEPLGYGFNPITTTLQRLYVGVIADILNITIFVTESPPGSRTGANLCLYSPHWSELLRLVTRVDGPNSPHRHTLHVALLIQSEVAQPCPASPSPARTHARQQNGTTARTTHFTLSQQRGHIVLSTRLQEPALVQQFCGT